MSDDTVIPLRRRSEVPRRLETTRTTPTKEPWWEHYPVRIAPNVDVCVLWQALTTAGLVLRWDDRTQGVVLTRDD